jgi:hypothetical protein
MIENLKELFDMASSLARGDYKSQYENRKLEPVSIKERQKWVRVAAYTAQILNSVTDGFDERQIDRDLAELERLVNEARAKGKTTQIEEGTRQREEPPKSTEG